MNSHVSLPPVSLVREGGKGRAVVLLREDGRFSELCKPIVDRLQSRARVLEFAMSRVDASRWEAQSRAVRAALRDAQVRSASLIAFGAAGTIAQDICVSDLRMVRTLVLVDATTRAHAGLLQRLVDKIEKILPLGLPLRLRTRDFDGAPYLHRMRCPALVVTTAGSSSFERAQAELIARGLPTAWRSHLVGSDQSEELCERLLQFQDVPAKCPQRAA